MRKIIKYLGGVMLLTCLSLLLLTGCNQQSKLKLAVEVANTQCPISIGSVGEISSITFDSADVTYHMLINEDNLDLNALEKNPGTMKSTVTALFRNPKAEVEKILKMIVATESGIKFVYKGEKTEKEVEYYLGVEDLKDILKQNITEKKSDKSGLEEMVNVTNVSCPIAIDEATTLNKLTIEADKVVYNYTVDEKIVNITAMKENRERMKQTIKGSLKMAEPSLRKFLETCVKDNKGLAYRYVGNTSKKSIEYIFTVAELKALL